MEHRLISGRLCTVRPRTGRVAASINYVEDLVLSQDNNQDYKFVLSLNEDSINMNCDFFVNTDCHTAVYDFDRINNNVKTLHH